mgnify:CR=1 FL=1
MPYISVSDVYIMSIFTDPTQKRFVLHPIRHDNLWSIFKKQQQVIWSTEEIDFSQDDVDWKTMDEDTKHFILTIIGFFAGSDMLIIDNLMDNFMSEVTVAECKTFYTLQAFVETIHSETYSLMLTKFAKGKNDELSQASLPDKEKEDEDHDQEDSSETSSESNKVETEIESLSSSVPIAQES